MQSLTTTQLAHLLRGGLIGYDITVTPTVGAGFTITEDDILEGSFMLDRSQWSSSQAVEIGNADAAELSFILDNSDGRWNAKRIEGATMELSFDIDGEALAGGKFIADRPVKGSMMLSVSALDYMAKFNVLYDGNLTYPATLLQIVQDACTDCGVTLGTASFTNSSYSVTAAPVENGLTYHQLIAWVAQLAGCNAWCDEDGELRLTWYGENNTIDGFSIDASMQFQEVSHGELECQLTGVEYVTEDTTYSVGGTGYVFRFTDNPLLQSGFTDVLANIHSKVCSVKFLPFDNLPTVCLPNLWPGDTVVVDAVSFVPQDDGAELTAGTGADIAQVTNGAGIDGTNIATTTTYFKAAVLIGRHTISTRSDMIGVGETATVIGYQNGNGLSDTMRNTVKAIATTKVESLAIERTLTVGASTVVVRIDDTNGISITKDGTKVFGVDSDGNLFASRMASDQSPDTQYGIIGDFPGEGIGLALYDTTRQSSPYFSVIHTVWPDGSLAGFSFVDGNSVSRLGFYNNGDFSYYDQNHDPRLYVTNDGYFIVYDQNGVQRIASSSTGDVYFRDASDVALFYALNDHSFHVRNSGDTKSVIEATTTTVEIKYPGATNHALGVDSTGPYKVVGGTKTYL